MLNRKIYILFLNKRHFDAFNGPAELEFLYTAERCCANFLHSSRNAHFNFINCLAIRAI